MGWSVRKYVKALTGMGKRCTGMQEHVEEELIRLFPPGRRRKLAEPCVICDTDGIILMWFLPGLLDFQRQVGRFSFVKCWNINLEKDQYVELLEHSPTEINGETKIHDLAGERNLLPIGNGMFV